MDSANIKFALAHPRKLIEQLPAERSPAKRFTHRQKLHSCRCLSVTCRPFDVIIQNRWLPTKFMQPTRCGAKALVIDCIQSHASGGILRLLAWQNHHFGS